MGHGNLSAVICLYTAQHITPLGFAQNTSFMSTDPDNVTPSKVKHLTTTNVKYNAGYGKVRQAKAVAGQD